MSLSAYYSRLCEISTNCQNPSFTDVRFCGGCGSCRNESAMISTVNWRKSLKELKGKELGCWEEQINNKSNKCKVD